MIVPNPKPRTQSGHDRADSIKLALAFAAIYLVWGSTYLAIRYAVETIPPLVTAGIRHTIAGSDPAGVGVGARLSSHASALDFRLHRGRVVLSDRSRHAALG